jgi:histidinol-phosphatase (PHP family)
VIVDYHMHLRAPDGSIDHTVDAVERFVEVAAGRGVDEIGFSEHVYYFQETAELWWVPYQSERCRYSLEAYCDAIVEAKRRGLPVKLGLEVDWVPGREDRVAALLAPYPWDYLLGSIHLLGELSLDGEPSLVASVGPEAAADRYFDELVALARSGLVDVLAHPDLVKFFGHRFERDWATLAERLDGVCVEVSTAGRYKPHGELYPSLDLLREACRAEVPITLASDAHAPQDVGRDLALAVEHARAAGYETVTVFDARRRRQEPLG